MKEKFIILRSLQQPVNRSATRGATPRGRTAAASKTPNKFGVEVDRLTRNKVPDVQKNNDVVAVVPAMPMKLIQPLKGKAIKPKKNETSTWGIQAVAADTSPFTGKGVVVAVLDTGINSKHPAFDGIDIEQENFTSETKADINGHGTHCAGTIFGRMDGLRIGVATGIEKALIGKVLGENGGGSDLIARAINWAVQKGAQVISMSLGIDFPGYVDYLIQEEGLPPVIATSRALEGYRANVMLFERLASMIRTLGVGQFAQPTLLVAAAGNESLRDQHASYEVNVSPPAVSEGILSVGALGQGPRGFAIADFSNTGPMIAGPGVDILSADLGGGLHSLSGTSMAAPHVAGVAALWAEKLMGTRMFNATNLQANLLAAATMNGLKKGVHPFAVGAGLVQAPQLK